MASSMEIPNEKEFQTRKVVCMARRVENVYPGMSYSSYTTYFKLRDNATHSKKVLANVKSDEFIEHLEKRKPCTLTGDRLPAIAHYDWRSVCNAEMDRLLACGPSRDPVLHRGMLSNAYIKDRTTKAT